MLSVSRIAVTTFSPGVKRGMRINKKILRRVLDIEEYGDRISLNWIAGKENALADRASRNLEDRDSARACSLSVLGGLKS